MAFTHFVVACLVAIIAPISATAQAEAQLTQDANARIPAGSRFYIDPIEGGYDIYLAAAMHKKDVPIILVTDKTKAADEQASISVTHIASGEVVYAYSANKKNSAHGKQTTAEACAKHLKEAIEKGK
jgi:hypothetical protein